MNVFTYAYCVASLEIDDKVYTFDAEQNVYIERYYDEMLTKYLNKAVIRSKVAVTDLMSKVSTGSLDGQKIKVKLEGKMYDNYQTVGNKFKTVFNAEIHNYSTLLKSAGMSVTELTLLTDESIFFQHE